MYISVLAYKGQADPHMLATHLHLNAQLKDEQSSHTHAHTDGHTYAHSSVSRRYTEAEIASTGAEYKGEKTIIAAAAAATTTPALPSYVIA